MQLKHIEFHILVLSLPSLGNKVPWMRRVNVWFQARLNNPLRWDVGSNVQFHEADSPVMPSIKERIEPVWVTLWTEAACPGWRFCVVCQRDLVAQLDGEGRSRELCVRMRRMSRKTCVLAVYLEGEMMYRGRDANAKLSNHFPVAM